MKKNSFLAMIVLPCFVFNVAHATPPQEYCKTEANKDRPWSPWVNSSSPWASLSSDQIRKNLIQADEKGDLHFHLVTRFLAHNQIPHHGVNHRYSGYLYALEDWGGLSKVREALKNPANAIKSVTVPSGTILEYRRSNFAPENLVNMGGGIVGERPLIASILCKDFGARIGSDCKDALQYTLNRFLFAAKGPLIGFEAYKDLFDYPEYFMAGATKLALKVMDRIATGNAPKESLWDDAVDAFKDPSIPLQVTEKRVLQFMAAYGTRGVNLRAFPLVGYFDAKDISIYLSLLTVGYGLHVLDQLAQREGRVYSIPHAVGTACDSGKAYHFWFSAMMSHYLHYEKGYSKDGAMRAAYLSGFGYQFRRPVGEAGGTDRGVNTLNKTVMDLHYYGIGATFPFRVASAPATDQVFQEYIKRAPKAGYVEDPKQNELAKYVKFKDTVSGDTMLDQYMKLVQ